MSTARLSITKSREADVSAEFPKRKLIRMFSLPTAEEHVSFHSGNSTFSLLPAVFFSLFLI